MRIARGEMLVLRRSLMILALSAVTASVLQVVTLERPLMSRPLEPRLPVVVVVGEDSAPSCQKGTRFRVHVEKALSQYPLSPPSGGDAKSTTTETSDR